MLLSGCSWDKTGRQCRVRQKQGAVGAGASQILSSRIQTYSYRPETRDFKRKTGAVKARFIFHIVFCFFVLAVVSAMALFCSSLVLLATCTSKIAAFMKGFWHRPEPISLVSLPPEKMPPVSLRPPVPQIRIEVKARNRRNPPGEAMSFFEDTP